MQVYFIDLAEWTVALASAGSFWILSHC